MRLRQNLIPMEAKGEDWFLNLKEIAGAEMEAEVFMVLMMR
jgi:hypothetical protein